MSYLGHEKISKLKKVNGGPSDSFSLNSSIHILGNLLEYKKSKGDLLEVEKEKNSSIVILQNRSHTEAVTDI